MVLNVFELVMTGLFVGVGSALGAYLANKALINRLESLLTKLNNKKRR